MINFIIATRNVRNQVENEDNFQLNCVNFGNIFKHLRSSCTSIICLKPLSIYKLNVFLFFLSWDLLLRDMLWNRGGQTLCWIVNVLPSLLIIYLMEKPQTDIILAWEMRKNKQKNYSSLFAARQLFYFFIWPANKSLATPDFCFWR